MASRQTGAAACGVAMKTRRRKTTKVKRHKEPAAARRHRSSADDLQKQLDQQSRELAEAREQQAATSEVLRVISSSPGELEPVFKAMLANAVRICEAKFGSLFLREGDGFRNVCNIGGRSGYTDWYEREPMIVLRDHHQHIPLARVAGSKAVIHVPDLAAEQAYIEHDPRMVALVESAGARSLLAVPMLKENELVGAIAIYRQEVRPFSDKQIALLTNFADQAVIAIENARLLRELRQRTDDLAESLEQQTATSEVLQVISSSPGELEPVFQAMLENATRICDAKFGILYRYTGELFDAAALFGAPAQLVHLLQRQGPFRPEAGSGLDHVLRTKGVFRKADASAGHVKGASTKFGGARSIIAVPMLKEGVLIGVLSIYRQEVRPFTDKQVALLTSFASQAVIAIENTRLLNELRKSLQQQTATADVLKTISSSPGELQPVFDAMLENATRICEAKLGNLFLREGDNFRAVAVHGGSG